MGVLFARESKGAGDNAEMADGEDRGVVETINERNIEGYSLKVQGSCGFGYLEWGGSYCG